MAQRTKQLREGMGDISIEMAIDEEVMRIANLLGKDHRIQHSAQRKPSDRFSGAERGEIDRHSLCQHSPVEEEPTALVSPL